MFEQITNFIVKNRLITSGDKVVIGRSGGPDSVFLLYFLASIREKYDLKLIAAHLNHEWRKEADQEEKDCELLAQQLNIPFVTAKRSALSLVFKFNGSQEEHGRKMRRHFFEKVLHEHNAHAIALAHHLQDQEETFFIRLIRGSSLTGLTAMKPQHGLYIRPLLETNKSDILAWLHEHNIAYATDTTNESSDYLRNRIRMNVLPAMRTCDDRFEINFPATLNRLQSTEQFLEKLAHKTFEEISCFEDNQRMIDIKQLLDTDETLSKRILMYWLINERVPFPATEAFLNEIMRFLIHKHGGTHATHQKWSLVKKHNKAFIKQT